MKFLKEVLHLGRFFWRTPKEYKRIIFYSEHGGYYPNFEGLINVLTEKHRQTICYVTSDLKDPILKSSNEKIRVFYFNSLLSLFMGMVNCKVFVMTMPDLNRFYLKRSMNPVHYVYVFHSPVSTHLAYLPGAFDYYDSLLCIGPYQVKEIRKYEKMHALPEKELIEAGYYRIERIHTDFKKYREEKEAGEDKTTVLIAPSWGVANVLESCGEPLCELLLDAGYKVIVRPHPETVRRTPEVPKALEKRFGDNPDFTLEWSVATNDSIFRADVLICDMSGMVLEYALGTERPVLFLDVPYKIRNENYKELGMEPLELSIRDEAGQMVTLDKLDRVPEVIEDLLANRDKYQKRLAKIREENIFAFGHSSEIGASHILKKSEN